MPPALLSQRPASYRVSLRYFIQTSKTLPKYFSLKRQDFFYIDLKRNRPKKSSLNNSGLKSNFLNHYCKSRSARYQNNHL